MNDDENSLDTGSEDAIQPQPMTGETIRTYRESLHLSRNKFLQEMYLKLGKSYSEGYWKEVEKGRVPVTSEIKERLGEFKKRFKK